MQTRRYPGAFTFTFMDNGVTSKEYWRVVDAADDLSWALYYYAGAAKSAGQMYVGAVLATPDGLWPPATREMEAASKERYGKGAAAKCGR